MSAVLKENDDGMLEGRSRVARWRKGGPALFAVEALGLPAKWDEVKKEGVLDWQWKASKAIVEKRRVSIRSGHGVGKSSLLSWTILWFHVCYFPAKTGCTAPSRTQMEDVLWAELSMWHGKLKKLHPQLGGMFEWKSDGFSLVESPKESFAVARTARRENPEALQGLHSKNIMLLIDEATGVDEAIFEAGRGSLSADNAFVVMASNPTRLSGTFYDTHHKLREMWECVVVNGEECPLQSQRLRDEIIAQYGKDSNQYRIRVLGEFPRNEDDVVIPMELCEAARYREVEAFGPRVWGVDVARFGSDRTVLVKRCTNATVDKHKSWSGMDTMQTVGRIYAEWKNTTPEQRPVNIFVDVIGIGAGVVDRLIELGLPVVGVNVAESASISDQYMRSRDELWFSARRWLEKKDCKLCDDDTLIAELCLPKYGYINGKLKVESKDEMRKRFPRSPDVADAFCLTFGLGADIMPASYKTLEPEYFPDY